MRQRNKREKTARATRQQGNFLVVCKNPGMSVRLGDHSNNNALFDGAGFYVPTIFVLLGVKERP